MFHTLLDKKRKSTYGEGALTRHPKAGKYRRPRPFVMKLSNSRRALRTPFVSTISKRAYSSPTSTIRSSTGSTPRCWSMAKASQRADAIRRCRRKLARALKA
jgi:hypothetical protein